MNTIIKGTPGSSGIVQGKVRVIIKENQFTEFKPGEILVTKQTSPAWTPLLMAAKGVVTEMGGQLSHAAIIAREYGIPAVLGVKGITKELKSGQEIKLDGTKGSIEAI